MRPPRTSRALLGLTLICAGLSAHPASGIVVDAEGNVFFIDSRHAVMKIDSGGHLTTIRSISDGHWLTLDQSGSFSNSQPRYFERITPDGAVPALIFAGGGSPIAVGSDGALYYASGPGPDDPFSPGGLALARNFPNGRLESVSDALKQILHEWDDGITGLTAGPDQSIYAATWTGLLRIRFDGTVTVISHPISVPECDPDPADHKPGNRLPYLRGIAVLLNGTVYAAATSCHAVISITRNGELRTALTSERPWSPTGVAAHGNDVYVLEYTNANGPANEGWRPRVRKIGANGQVSTVASVP